MEKHLDPTDKILDDMDAKLLSEVRQRSNNYVATKVDVNDDSGVIYNNKEVVNKKYDDTTLNQDTKKSDIGTEQIDPDQKSKLSNGSLHQSYDADINILRRLLKDNFDEVKAMDKQSIPSNNISFEQETIAEVLTPSYVQPSLEPKPLPKSVTFQEQTKEKEAEKLNSFESSSCSCDCEKELSQLTRERDELKSWVRKGEASRTTIEERKELERALHTAKAQLFQDKKRAREKYEDLQDKYEERIHAYEEQLAEKEQMIAEIQQTPSVNTVTETQTTSNNTEEQRLIKTLQSQLYEKETQLKRFTDICESQQGEIEKLNIKMKSQESELIQYDSRVKSTSESLQKDVSALQLDFDTLKNDNISLESSNQQLQHKNETLVLNFQLKFDELKNENERLVACNNLEVKRLGDRERTLNDQIAELTKHCQKYQEINQTKDLELKKEQNVFNNLVKKEKMAGEKKMEALKSEISSLSAKNFRLEVEIKEKYLECEKKLQKENTENKQKVESLQMDVADAITRLKDFEKESQNKDENLSQCMMEECHKLALLHHNMKLLSTRSKNPFHFNKNLPTPSKKSLTQLQDVVELVCRSVNDLICEVAQLRRETRQKQTNQIAAKKNETEDELKVLKEKLSLKDSQLHHLETNMNEWKDLTAHRLAEKFQQELQIQVERKLSQQSNIESNNDGDYVKTYPITSNTPSLTYSSKPNNDTSTVQLLCHLQGRVKQLRVENDLLRSSSFIKGIAEK